MQSVRRLLKCEDNPLQILVLMRTLGLARGQGSAEQSASFAVDSWRLTVTCTVFAIVLGGVFIWIMNFKRQSPIRLMQQHKLKKEMEMMMIPYQRNKMKIETGGISLQR